MVFCPECGKEIPSGGNYCLFCGCSLDRVMRFLEETELTKEKEKRHITGEITEQRKAEAEAWVLKGDAHARDGADKDALKCYTTAIGIDPSSYEAWNRKAELLFHLGRTMEARICRENIIRLTPDHAATPVHERPARVTGKDDVAEKYLGGLSSPSIKFSPIEGNNKDISGVIGTNVGGYGIYVTDRRIFIIKNERHVFGHPKGPAIGGFLYAELFGRTMDRMKRNIEELEVYKDIEIGKKDLEHIIMKRPVLLTGHISFVKRNAEVYKLFIDHKNVYDPIRHLMLKFYPEIVVTV